MRCIPILFLSAGLFVLGLFQALYSAPPAARHMHGGIAYLVTDFSNGDTLAEGMLLLVDLDLENGNVVWHADSLVITPGTVGTLEVNQTHPFAEPQGFLWLEVCGDTLAQYVASGVFAAALPAVGTRLPLTLPLSAAVKLDAARLGFPGRAVDVSLYQRMEAVSAPKAVEAKGL